VTIHLIQNINSNVQNIDFFSYKTDHTKIYIFYKKMNKISDQIYLRKSLVITIKIMMK
jgi:hypothetical protein